MESVRKPATTCRGSTAIEPRGTGSGSRERGEGRGGEGGRGRRSRADTDRGAQSEETAGVKQAESARGCAGSGASKWCGPPPPPRAGCGFGFLAGARGYAGVVASAGLRVPAQDLTRPLGQDLQASISIRDLHNSYSLLIVYRC
jgi:hypothetical protein